MKFLGILLFLIGAVSLGLYHTGNEPLVVSQWLTKMVGENAYYVRAGVAAVGALMLLIGMMLGRKSRL